MKLIIGALMFISSLAFAETHICPHPNKLKYSSDIQYDFQKDQFDGFSMHMPTHGPGWRIPKSLGMTAILYTYPDGNELGISCTYQMLSGNVRMEKTITPVANETLNCRLYDSGRTDSRLGSKAKPRVVQFSSRSPSKGGVFICDLPLRGVCTLECR